MLNELQDYYNGLELASLDDLVRHLHSPSRSFISLWKDSEEILYYYSPYRLCKEVLRHSAPLQACLILDSHLDMTYILVCSITGKVLSRVDFESLSVVKRVLEEKNSLVECVEANQQLSSYLQIDHIAEKD